MIDKKYQFVNLNWCFFILEKNVENYNIKLRRAAIYAIIIKNDLL